jgi:branched-chain amino acid transport system substrate-binding protein
MRWWGALALVGIFGLVACLPYSTGAPAPAQTEQRPVVVGATLSLTGGFADTAKEIRTGYELWADDVNSRGGLLGRKVELKIYDDEGKPDKAAQLLERLITVDKVDLILGAYPGTTVAAQAPIAERYKYVYIGMGAHSPSFEQGYQYFFGGPPLLGSWYPLAFLDLVKAVRSGTVSGPQFNTIALLFMNNIIGQDARKGTLDFISKNMPDLKVVVDELYDSPLANADPLIAKARQAQADIVMLGGNPAENALMLRTLRVQGFQPKAVWVYIGPHSLPWVKEMGELGERVFTGFTGDASTSKAKTVDQLYRSKFNQPIDLYILAGYNYGYVLEAAVNGTKSLDNTKLRDWLKSSEVDTPLGKLKFDQRGLPQPISVAYQIQNGQVLAVWPKGTETKPAIFR